MNNIEAPAAVAPVSFATMRRAPAASSSGEDRLLAALQGGALESAWNECLDAWGGVTAEQAVSARLFVGSKREQVLAHLMPVSDPADREACALLTCLQLRAEWFLLNTAVGYAGTDTERDAAALRAALTSTLLDTMEANCPAAAVGRIADFTSGLMDAGAEEPTPSAASLTGSPDVRRRLQSLLSTIESLSERVVRQEAELIILRAGQDSLQEALGGEDVGAGEIARRLRVLHARAEAREVQEQVDEVHDQVLLQAFGTTDRLRIAAAARELRESLAASEQRVARLEAERERAAVEAGEGVRPDEIAGHLRDMKGALHILAAEKLELESAREAAAREAAGLRAERDRLLAATGCASPEELAARLRELQDSAAAFQDVAALLGDMGRKLDTI